MKNLLLLYFLLIPQLSHSQECWNRLFAEDYTHIRFSYYKEDNWPIFFEAVLKSDTLSVNFERLDVFLQSLYIDAAFVPMSYFMNHHYFAEIFGCSKYDKTVYTDFNIFKNDYYQQFRNLEKKGKITLASGEILEYSYFDIRGVFSEIDKQKYVCLETNMGDTYDTSNGISFSFVNKVIVPIAISNYKKKEKNLVFISSTERNGIATK